MRGEARMHLLKPAVHVLFKFREKRRALKALDQAIDAEVASAEQIAGDISKWLGEWRTFAIKVQEDHDRLVKIERTFADFRVAHSSLVGQYSKLERVQRRTLLLASLASALSVLELALSLAH